jgi:methionyl-tRNA synthetase
MERPKFYITTPIYYPSADLHIGNTYCTVCADVIARYKRQRGFDVMFLAGTDEHGLKIETASAKQGKTPMQFLDEIVNGIRELWKLMNISYDRFIRTTDEYHVTAIRKIFKKMYDNGDIYKGVYKGKYCVPDESFWTESQLVNGKCPECGREVIDAEEEAYFFRQSAYAERILKLFEENPDFLLPKSRVNEMVNNFLKPGLEDICVSRTSFKWGIQVDFDPEHVVYVWVDALFNYMTALGFENDANSDLARYWPADLHLVGKEIVRFHSILWPAMLMSLQLPLPKHVFGHGWLTLGGQKIGKSLGNAIDPVFLAERFGVDAIRYFLTREVTFGSDCDFTNERMLQRINSDLANNLGNLVSRTLSMSDKYAIPANPANADVSFIALFKSLRERFDSAMEVYAFQTALSEVFAALDLANKYIDQTMPWALAKDEGKRAELERVVATLLYVIKEAAFLLAPFIPDSAARIEAQLAGAERFPLFPRLDIKKELENLNAPSGNAHA